MFVNNVLGINKFLSLALSPFALFSMKLVVTNLSDLALVIKHILKTGYHKNHGFGELSV